MAECAPAWLWFWAGLLSVVGVGSVALLVALLWMSARESKAADEPPTFL